MIVLDFLEDCWFCCEFGIVMGTNVDFRKFTMF